MNYISLGSIGMLVVWGLLSVAVLASGYIGVAQWLQQRSAWVGPHVSLDAVYIVAGSKDRGRRVDAVVAWMQRSGSSSTMILIAEDPNGNPCLDEKGERTPAVRWQSERIASELPLAEIAVVPGHYYGTDGEMEALAKFLESKPAIQFIAIATCRSHVRRALQRARTHVTTARVVGAIPAASARVDYTPRRVASETLKILRDSLGLTRAPFLHRGWRRD